MKHTNYFLLLIFFVFALVVKPENTQGQCFQVYDGFGNIQATPYFIGCSGSDYTVFVQTDISLGSYTINWGDGTPNTTGTSLVPPAYVQHIYAQTVDTFNITITDNSNGCSVSGVVVLEEPVNASIQIPLGGVTQVCAPAPIDFINSSTNVSPTTTFTWDFGDGTPPLVFGPANSWQTLTHAYQKNTVSCETVVTLTAENYCSSGNPTVALFQPLMVYDVDTAVISASATLLCYPDTVVHFSNATIKNCLPEGNNQQRYEYWNLGDYWGLGYDSIINWLPFDPPARPGHTIAFPGVGSYTIMMIDSNMCGQDTAYITITIIDPPVSGITTSYDSACVGEVIHFSGSGSNGANAYYWNFGGGFIQMNSNVSTSFFNPGTYNVQFIASINGTSGVCQDTSQFSVYIKPSPVADFVLDVNQGCDSLQVQISDSTVGAAAWSWNFGNGNTSTLANPPVQTYTNGTYTVSLEVTHQNGCSDTETNTVSVYPSPTADFIANSVCFQDYASFQDTSVFNASDPIISWNWNFGDGNSSSLQNPTNMYTNIGNYNVTLVVATAHCADTISDSVTVEAKPVADFTVDKMAGCSPLDVATTNSSVGATGYIWDFGNGYGSTGTNPLVSYFNSDTSDTTFPLTLIATTDFGCTDTASMPITVYGNPIAAFTSDASPACGPFDVNFVNMSTGAVSYFWDFGDSSATSTLVNPSHTFGNTSLFITNYTVQLVATNANGCTDTASVDMPVYPEPNFPFSTIPDSGCSPLTVTFPAIVGAVLYAWDFGDGTTSTGQTPTHTFYNSTTNDQVFNVQLIATSPFGCQDTTVEQVTVFPAPTAIFTASDSIGCGPLAISFTNGSLGADSYFWNFGDGDTTSSDSAVVPHVFTNTTGGQLVYTTSLHVSTDHGCVDSTEKNITVHPPVVADFSSDSAGCSPFTVNYTNNSQGANAYYWNFGGSAISTGINPSHTFYTGPVNDTSYNVLMVATSQFGCTDTLNKSVTVYHSATAGVSSNYLNGCTPFTTTFTNSSYGFDNIYIDFGDGSFSNNTFSSIPHTYMNTGSAPIQNDITLIASTIHGCNDTASTQFTIFPPVQAGFTGDTIGCSPLVISFQNLSSGGSSYQWDFGNGNMSNSPLPVETFTTQSTTSVYTTTLWTTSVYGCSDSVLMNITVHPSANASILPDVVQGCSPLAVNFTNNSSNSNDILWEFGDGGSVNSTSNIVSHVYQNTTVSSVTYNVNVIASTLLGCNDTTDVQIEVFPEVTVNAQFDTVGCSPFVNQFQNLSIGTTNYVWDFGNGNVSTSASPTQTFVNNSIVPAVFPVTLVGLSNYGCSDTLTRNITVYPQPTATFLATPAIQSFPNTIVSVTNTTMGNWNYKWTFESVGNSYIPNPAPIDFMNPGDYTITLVAYNSYCGDTTSERVTILPPPPVADFSGGAKGCSPVTVSFTNNSAYGVEYLWDFGDGNTSIQENPTYTYFLPGVYTVRLKVIGLNGEETKVLEKAVEVYPNAVANFEFQPLKVAALGDKTFFYNQSANADIFYWNFGDGTTSEEKNPIYQYKTVGEFPITLIANNQYNCPDTLTHPTYITVEAKGEISFPNAFVPSNTGGNGGYYNSNVMDNSIFYPISQGVKAYHLVIYNRWGEMVFETFDVNQGWDGYYRGELSAQDVYLWKAQLTMVNGEEKVYAGDVTLLQ
jgi:PKD repeat protein